jgi:hypothetical protein
MTKTTTTERFEDGELVERVTVVEDEVVETPQAPLYPNTQPSIQPWNPYPNPYIGDPMPNTPWYYPNWC